MALLQRLAHFFSSPDGDPAVTALYAGCVAQTRSEKFYKDLGVPDNIDGRFDLLLLHVYLSMRRLGGQGDTKQKLFDLMFADMDHSLREMGVGDMSIGKRMKPMIAAFYGRAQAYEKALAEGDAALAETLGRNLWGGKPPEGAALKMAVYVRRCIAALDAQSPSDIASGVIKFPELEIG